MCRRIKFIYACLTFAVLAVTAGCSNNEARNSLAAEVERSNASCPVSMGANGSLTSVVYDRNENVVTMSYLMNEHYMNPEAFDASEKYNKEAMAAYLQSDEGRSFLEMLAQADASICLSFMIGTSGPHFVSLSSEEIDSVSAGIRTIDGARGQLSDLAEEDNNKCPIMLSAGLRTDSVTIQGRYLTYFVVVTDSLQLSTSEQIASTRADLKQSLIDARKEAGAARTLHLLKMAEYGIRYSIRLNNTVEPTTRVIDITPDEISEIANTQ